MGHVLRTWLCWDFSHQTELAMNSICLISRMFTVSYDSKKNRQNHLKNMFCTDLPINNFERSGGWVDLADKCEPYCRQILDLPSNLRFSRVKMLQDSAPSSRSLGFQGFWTNLHGLSSAMASESLKAIGIPSSNLFGPLGFVSSELEVSRISGNSALGPQTQSGTPGDPWLSVSQRWPRSRRRLACHMNQGVSVARLWQANIRWQGVGFGASDVTYPYLRFWQISG
jgi:hypothetical protein